MFNTPVENVTEEVEEQPTEDVYDSSIDQSNILVAEEEPNDEQYFNVPQNDTNQEVEKIEISDTPIEEINKLTEYKEDTIDKTDITTLFDRLSINVQDASDIFKRNTEMKKKIDDRFEELKKLQNEIEKSKKAQIDEIDNYKNEILDKLNEKKAEIESRLNTLKDIQVNLEKEKEEFENYKKEQEDEITRVQREIQESYDERREELEHIEDVLRRQKDDLDDRRSKLSLDLIQYESDKNALANNILKFNEVVDSFTKGMDSLEEE